jgi:photosystem II stability/assembly factor-like uncharacterized protein
MSVCAHFGKRTLGAALGVLIAGWAPLGAHQPHDPVAVVALSPNYAQDQTLFLATAAITMPLPMGEYAPMISTDGGLSFTILRGLPNLAMRCIVISPGYATDGTVFMAGEGGLWRSTDRGMSWQNTMPTQIVAVALDPQFATSGAAFALTKNTILASTDHGATWSPVGAPSPLSSNLSALAVSTNYSADSTLVAGTVADGIFVSTDGGFAWTAVGSGPKQSRINTLVFSPAYATDGAIFAGTLGQGVYISVDQGVTWSPVSSGMTDLNVTAITLSWNFAGNNQLWASTTSGGVFVSQDRGNSWAPTATVPRPLSPQTTLHYASLASAKSLSGDALFVGMFEGLWKSSDGGSTWNYCDTLPTRLVRDLQLSPDYPEDQTVFASTYGGGTLWSYSGGQPPPSGVAWVFRNTDLRDAYPDANAMAPTYSMNRMAWIGTSSGLERAAGMNQVWQMMPMCGSLTFPRSLGVSSGFETDSTVFIGTHAGPGYPPTVTCDGVTVPNRGLFTSVDEGQNWEATGLQGDAVDSIAMSPNYPVDHTLFAGSSVSGLFKSADGGVTFTPITVVPGDNGVLRVACSPAYATDQTVFVGTAHTGIFKSTDGGATWRQLPNTGLLTVFSFAISPNYANDQTLFVGTLQYGLLKSTAGGQNLVPIAPLLGGFATAVALSPGYASDNTVFVATYLGIYKSTDGGTSWAYTGEPARQEEQRQFGSGAFYSIVYAGTWKTFPDLRGSTLQLISTSQSGATASLTFLGSGARWIGRRSAAGGNAQVLLDGSVVAAVNLQSSTTQEQQTLWVTQDLPCAPHTVTIKALPETGQAVNLDALDVWQDTCSWVTLGSQRLSKKRK